MTLKSWYFFLTKGKDLYTGHFDPVLSSEHKMILFAAGFLVHCCPLSFLLSLEPAVQDWLWCCSALWKHGRSCVVWPPVRKQLRSYRNCVMWERVSHPGTKLSQLAACAPKCQMTCLRCSPHCGQEGLGAWANEGLHVQTISCFRSADVVGKCGPTSGCTKHFLIWKEAAGLMIQAEDTWETWEGAG